MNSTVVVKENRKVGFDVEMLWDKLVDWFVQQIMKNEAQIIAEAQSHIDFTNKILG